MSTGTSATGPGECGKSIREGGVHLGHFLNVGKGTLGAENCSATRSGDPAVDDAECAADKLLVGEAFEGLFREGDQ